MGKYGIYWENDGKTMEVNVFMGKLWKILWDFHVIYLNFHQIFMGF